MESRTSKIQAVPLTGTAALRATLEAKIKVARLRSQYSPRAEIQSDLQMTKREAEDALHILVREGKVECAWPTTSPLAYQASA